MMFRVSVLFAVCVLSGPVTAGGATCTKMLNQQAAETNRATSVLLQLSRQGEKAEQDATITIAGPEMRMTLKAALEAHESTTASLERLSALKDKGCLAGKHYEGYAAIYLRTLALLDPLLMTLRS